MSNNAKSKIDQLHQEAEEARLAGLKAEETRQAQLREALEQSALAEIEKEGITWLLEFGVNSKVAVKGNRIEWEWQLSSLNMDDLELCPISILASAGTSGDPAALTAKIVFMAWNNGNHKQEFMWNNSDGWLIFARSMYPTYKAYAIRETVKTLFRDSDSALNINFNRK